MKIIDRRNESTRIKVPDTKDVPVQQQPPKFSFRYLAKKYCFSKLDKKEKVGFANTMYKLSQLSWNIIFNEDRHGLGFEKINRDAIRGTIPGHLTEDVSIIAFRFYKLAPMVGYRDVDGTFYIIWFDNKFKLYKH